MPSDFGPEDGDTDLRVSISPVMDFQFGFFLLTKHCIDPEKWVPEWVTEVTASGRAVADQLLNFWVAPGLHEVGGAQYREWGELLVAAWHTNTLFAPRVETFLDAADKALERGFEVPELASEPDSVRDLIVRRVAWLRDHPQDRVELIRLARSLWTLIEPHWEAFGRGAATRAAVEIVARARTEPDLRMLVPGNNYIHKEAFRAQIEAARSRGELVVVPLGLAGGGQFYWSFPGLVVVGAGVDSAEREAKRRERAERAANKLKVLSDPTRVGILYELFRSGAHHPSTVTELASQFGLSQPTVSVHVKMLREAGLVRAERDGNQPQF